MTQRKEAMEEERSRHHLRAFILSIVAIAIIALYAAFIVLQATHLPNVIASETDVKSASFREVEMDWEHLVIEHTGDLELGDMRWEITKDPGNETLHEGMHGDKDDDLIIVEGLGPGEFGVFLEPTGVNSAKEYDVTIREFYISPVTIDLVKLGALFFLAVLSPFLWYALWSRYTEKFREEYRLAIVAVALTMVLSAVVAFVPWY